MTRGRQRGRRVIASAYGWRVVMVTQEAPPVADGWVRVGLSEAGTTAATALAGKLAPAVVATMAALSSLSGALGVSGAVPMLEVRTARADVRRIRPTDG